MAYNNLIGSLVSKVVVIAPGAVAGVTVLAAEAAAIVKYGAGGSLEIGGSTLTAGAGYLLGTSEVLSMNVGGNIYLAATGATVTAYVLIGRSQGWPDSSG